VIRRQATIFSAPEEEVRVPPGCLAELGLGEGARVVVEVAPGRLLLTPYWDAAAVRADLHSIARDLAEVRRRLRRVTSLLPEPAEPDGAAEGAESTAEVGGADLLGTLECLLADDLDPALAKLQEALGSLGPFDPGIANGTASEPGAR
jgi:antitoxin component of MazEF toxin-antitoxin module